MPEENFMIDEIIAPFNVTQTTPKPSANFISFVDILVKRAQRTPDKMAFTFIQDSSGSKIRFTYQQLFVHASAIAARLQGHQLENCRVLLVMRSNLLFVIAFFACLLAGATAVPAPLPRREQLLKRVNDLAEDSGALAIMGDTDDVMQSCAGGRHSTLLGIDLRCIDLDDTDATDYGGPAWYAPRITADSLALLQYTSGSTGSPKGVMISHGNLMANSAAIQTALGFTDKTAQLVALPLFHDMGLIDGVLQPVFSGSPAYMMSPALFASAPHLWLQTISRYRIAISGGPNFMYDLATEAIHQEQLEGLDLTCWLVAFCGAEPIKVSTYEAFTQKFAGVGFQISSFYPCYGMAEVTLFATGHMPEPRTRSLKGATRMSRGPYPAAARSVQDIGCRSLIRKRAAASRMVSMARSGWPVPRSRKATGKKPRVPRAPSRPLRPTRSRVRSCAPAILVSCRMANCSSLAD
jgi:acyl-CoA synthetase (AMP-forming)/AMP-acid ligase II